MNLAQDFRHYAVKPSKAAVREKLARDCENVPVTVLPSPEYNLLRESKRKPLPEWEAAKARREKLKAKVKPVMYTQPQVMAMFDCPKSPDGYKKFDRMIERGEIPTPDWRRSTGHGKFTKRWFCERLDKFLQMRGIVERHA